MNTTLTLQNPTRPNSMGRGSALAILILSLFSTLLLPMQGRSQDFQAQSAKIRTEWQAISATPDRIKNGKPVVLKARLMYHANNNRNTPRPLANRVVTVGIGINTRGGYTETLRTDGHGWVTFRFSFFDPNLRSPGRRIFFNFRYAGDSIYLNRTAGNSYILIP